VTTEVPKNTERILFLLKIERVERPPRGLIATEGIQTASYCNFHGLTITEGSQTASLCIAHGLIAAEAGQTVNTSNHRISNLKVVVATMTV
jgi:hypothetical protein